MLKSQLSQQIWNPNIVFWGMVGISKWNISAPSRDLWFEWKIYENVWLWTGKSSYPYYIHRDFHGNIDFHHGMRWVQPWNGILSILKTSAIPSSSPMTEIVGWSQNWGPFQGKLIMFPIKWPSIWGKNNPFSGPRPRHIELVISQ